MKLTGGNQNIGVQSLGREQLNDGVAEAKSRAAFGVADQIDAYQAREAKHQSSMADSGLINADSTFERENDGVEYYDWEDEKLENYRPELTQYEGKQVPAYEVRAKMYEKSMNDSIETLGAGISNDRLREEWIMNKKGLAGMKTAERMIKRDQEQITSFNNEVRQTAKNHLDTGGYEAAWRVIETSELSKAEKDEARVEIDKRRETDMVADTLRMANGPFASPVEQEIALANLREQYTLYATDYDGSLSKEVALNQKNRLGAEISRLEKSQKAAAVENQSEVFAQKAMSDDMTSQDRSALFASIKDPDVRKRSRALYTNLRSFKDAEEVRVDKEKSDAFLDSIQKNNQSLDWIVRNAPSDAARNKGEKLFNQLMKGEEIVTSDADWLEARSGALKGNFDPSDWIGKLSSADTRKLSNLALDYGANSDQSSRAQTTNTNIKSRIGAMGYKIESDNTTKTSKRGNAMYRVFTTELAIAQKMKGGDLTFEEEQKLFDSIETKVYTKSGGSFWGYDFEDEEISLDDVPKGEIEDLVKTLKRLNQPVNAANVLDLYVGGEP